MTKKSLTVDQRLMRLEQDVDILKDRCMWTERALRIMGMEFQKNHLSQIQAEQWAKRANHLNNAMREVRRHLKDYGNQFDREPYLPDPENDK